MLLAALHQWHHRETQRCDADSRQLDLWWIRKFCQCCWILKTWVQLGLPRWAHRFVSAFESHWRYVIWFHTRVDTVWMPALLCQGWCTLRILDRDTLVGQTNHVFCSTKSLGKVWRQTRVSCFKLARVHEEHHWESQSMGPQQSCCSINRRNGPTVCRRNYHSKRLTKWTGVGWVQILSLWCCTPESNFDESISILWYGCLKSIRIDRDSWIPNSKLRWWF